MYHGFFDFLQPKSSASHLDRPVLARGARGGAVEQLQMYLQIPTDGVFGGDTEAAVRNFQASAGIPVTGTADARTWAALLGEEFRAPKQRDPAKQAQTAATIAAGADALKDLISSFAIPPSNQEEILQGSSVPAPTTQVSGGPSWGTIAVIGGTSALVLVGLTGLAIYATRGD